MATLTSETLDGWLHELAAVEVVAFEPGRWALLCAETLAVEVQHLPDEGVIVLSAALGRAREGDETATYRLLLQANALWQETGGVRMALLPGSGNLAQRCNVSLAGLDAEGLALRVQNFAAAARSWRVVIAADPAAGATEVPATHLTRV